MTTVNSSILFNSLPNDNIFECSKMKAFADDKINVTEKLKFVFGRVGIIVGKGENADYQRFLRFPQCFLKASFSKPLPAFLFFQQCFLKASFSRPLKVGIE